MNRMSSADIQTGHLRKYHSNFYYVEAEGVLYECALRGLLKKEGTEVLVGDYVALDNINPANQTARIVKVLERRNAITRPKIANVDQVLIVYSLKEPVFDPHQLDRYLTHVELAGLTPIICISKADLAQSVQDLANIQATYGQKLGYTILATSIHQPESLTTIRELAQGKTNVLAGPSGSGKSSLLNALNPNFQLRVGEVSDKIARGQHTTRHVELLALDKETLLADTPGFSQLKFNTVLPQQVEAVYRDFIPYREDCSFSDCLHLDETGCSVLSHLDSIIPSRYTSYQEQIAEAMAYKEAAKASSQKEEFGYKQIHRKGQEAMQILRLKDKDRDVSRRTQKQQVRLLEEEEVVPDEDS